MTTNTKIITFIIFALQFAFTGCSGQGHQSIDPKLMDNTPAENYYRPKHIAARDTSPGWQQDGQKLLLTGTVYKPDGRTPAPNVILYYYQTNTDGRYEYKPDEPLNLPRNSLGQTHGYIRGWVKTGSDGKYAIYTVRPGTYPTRSEPAHVHVTVIETGAAKGYYIDDFVFDDDILLTRAKRLKMDGRGGSGILRLVQKGDLHIGERNIILGANVAGYAPAKRPL
ncbi:dioxygenase family protein [Mucilaginibacter myungsuensis]|uniref:Intradiol ring-cleavage dioxygenase n=1 Tax=Mucilaginibacter myungsuensis TaxID=649104 RepID=A0A929KXV7_9SPHI|nr:intradiol ring-cleavage dioxygenase [Mucilaginibacter myungsuensis]MBE9663669.1 intradiol ring-cleavage dioxygenase [Mucilaginibacter myungsuensis]MDN3599007.1 intradiol ring-cleavage dioxygenase [Mucilaginibacter myungsuensis]